MGMEVTLKGQIEDTPAINWELSQSVVAPTITTELVAAPVEQKAPYVLSAWPGLGRRCGTMYSLHQAHSGRRRRSDHAMRTAVVCHRFELEPHCRGHWHARRVRVRAPSPAGAGFL